LDEATGGGTEGRSWTYTLEEENFTNAAPFLQQLSSNFSLGTAEQSSALLLFAIQHLKLTAGLVGLFVAAVIIVASVFSFGAAAGVAAIAGAATGAVGAGVIAGLATFFSVKRTTQSPQCPTTTPLDKTDLASVGRAHGPTLFIHAHHKQEV
jgi:hypothetical protein